MEGTETNMQDVIDATTVCDCCCVPLFDHRACIRCAVCPDLNLCCKCYSLGAEVGKHKKTHDYHILVFEKTSNHSVFSDTYPDWTVENDEHLLDNIEHFGFGNWEDSISGIVNKTPEIAESHFHDSFLESNIGFVTLRSATRPIIKDYSALSDSGPLSPTLWAPAEPVIDLTLDETQTLGYLAHRDDFEIDYDNSAEIVASDVKLSVDDDKVDVEYKLASIDMYAHVRRERERRKKIVKKNNLILDFLHSDKPGLMGRSRKKFSKDMKGLHEKFRIFGQFQTASQREEFLENMSNERKCRDRITELMTYRRNGITRIEDCEEFEDEKYLRDKRKEQQKKTGILSTTSSTSSLSSLVANTSTAFSRRHSKPYVSGKREDQPKCETPGLSKKESPTKEETPLASMGKAGEKLNKNQNTDLLSSREKRLCRNLGMTPSYYITLKTLIISDNLTKSDKDTDQNDNPKYNGGSDEVKEYLQSNHWIH